MKRFPECRRDYYDDTLIFCLEDGTSPFFPLAQLELARAAAIAGETTKSRRAYQDFFALWKDADADIPILIEAKQEYEKLK